MSEKKNMNYKDSERSYLSYESRNSPYSIFTYVRKDKSNFYGLFGYDYKDKEKVILYFDTYEEVHNKMHQLLKGAPRYYGT